MRLRLGTDACQTSALTSKSSELIELSMVVTPLVECAACGYAPYRADPNRQA